MLSRESIAGLIAGSPPLLGGYRSAADQLQPNGFDLTVAEIHRLLTPGSMGRDPDRREVSSLEPLDFDDEAWVHLPAGHFLITFQEEVALPRSLMALIYPRSSLLRSGVSIHTGVGDAGYRGRPQALMVVHHPAGYHLQQGARVAQLVFFPLDCPTEEGYSGAYLNENLPTDG